MSVSGSIYAVITGDIVDSREIPVEARSSVNFYMTEMLENMEVWLQKSIDKRTKIQVRSDTFRGDSFQCEIKPAWIALRAAMFLKLKVQNHPLNEEHPIWDVRIGVGTGTVSVYAPTVGQSDGEAYQRSGKVLDGLKDKNKIEIEAHGNRLNAELKVSFELLNALINSWTRKQRVVLVQLLLERSQKEISTDLGISQSAVSQRVQSSEWYALKTFLDRFEDLMS